MSELPRTPTLGNLESLVLSHVGLDEDTPDHLYLEALQLARDLDSNPGLLYLLHILLHTEVNRILGIITRRIDEQHDDIQWLDDHLSQVYPAWYATNDRDPS